MSHFFLEIYKLLGFRSGRDMLESAFGLKFYSVQLLKIQISTTMLASVVGFCAQWIWDPPSALFLLLAMEVLNTFYGIRVAKKIKKEPFSFEKFCRFFGKLFAVLAVLSMVKNMINSYEAVKVVDFTVFIWLAGTKLRKIISKQVALRVMEDGLPGVIQQFIQQFLSTKVAALLVDAAQGVKPAPADLPSPNPEPAPPTEPQTP
ncbi:hypothetical protein [Hymenobacter guriensis]|uniref:Holin n=1 Tax=Hymenobacter guriensis TaxID=2793065 RepID=A0ABS0KYY2_9BACT|nr:hypothetical protein [Hymenobacter guriensis]MBG8553077.1 hypothetical protein [Hymenobacter guriensis]